MFRPMEVIKYTFLKNIYFIDDYCMILIKGND